MAGAQVTAAMESRPHKRVPPVIPPTTDATPAPRHASQVAMEAKAIEGLRRRGETEGAVAAALATAVPGPTLLAPIGPRLLLPPGRLPLIDGDTPPVAPAYAPSVEPYPERSRYVTEANDRRKREDDVRGGILLAQKRAAEAKAAEAKAAQAKGAAALQASTASSLRPDGGPLTSADILGRVLSSSANLVAQLGLSADAVKETLGALLDERTTSSIARVYAGQSDAGGDEEAQSKLVSGIILGRLSGAGEAAPTSRPVSNSVDNTAMEV